MAGAIRPNNPNRRLRLSGFTLVEVMVTVGLVGLLAAISVAAVINARDRAAISICVGNLNQISRAKSLWAFEFKQPPDAQATDDDLFGPEKFLKRKPVCPSAGEYAIRPLNQDPDCTKPKHVLPE